MNKVNCLSLIFFLSCPAVMFFFCNFAVNAKDMYSADLLHIVMICQYREIFCLRTCKLNIIQYRFRDAQISILHFWFLSQDILPLQYIL